MKFWGSAKEEAPGMGEDTSATRGKEGRCVREHESGLRGGVESDVEKRSSACAFDRES